MKPASVHLPLTLVTLGWAPVEDGDFSARLGDRLDASIISVSKVSASPEVLGVGAADAYVMPASSLCGDDLPLIALEDNVDVPLVNLRFGGTAAGQQLLLSGFCADAATASFQRLDSASVTRAITTTAATEEGPPRAIVVSNSIPAFSAGGAEVLRTDTSSFQALLESRRNRRGEWFQYAAGRLELCNCQCGAAKGALRRAAGTCW